MSDAARADAAAPITLVTGATGFVGRALSAELERRGRPVRRATRTAVPGAVAVGAIGWHTDWAAALDRVDTVIHTAARVHVMRDDAIDPDAAFRDVNVLGTRRLAEQAAARGVTRLVFVSSIKVNGDVTSREAAHTAFATPDPADAYARSKWAAEQALHEIARETGLGVTIVRPPLVYGPEAGGNFARLKGLVARGVPLPLGAVDNRRSLVALENLVDLLIHCLNHPNAANETFLAADGEDLSTPALIRLMADGMGRRARLFPVPPRLLRAAARAMGKSELGVRLLDSLRVDTSHTRQRLDWLPPAAPRDAIVRAVALP